MLDLRTIYVVTSLTVALLGVLQLGVFFIGRFGRWPLWWGISNLLIGAGTFMIALRDHASALVSIELGNIITWVGYVCMLAAVRVFAGRPLHPRWLIFVIFLGSVVFTGLDGPLDTSARIVFGSLICCIVDLLIVRESINLARNGGLRSAWILTGLYSFSAVIFASRALFAAGGEIGDAALFDNSAAHTLLAMFAVLFVVLRTMVMTWMAAEQAHHEINTRANTDPLTGALNRTGLALAFIRLKNASVTALLIDMDHFKAVNDRHGHAAGDSLLVRLVASIRSVVESGDVVARLGGDEFVVLLRDISEADAIHRAEALRHGFLEEVAAQGGLSISPTLSIGVARQSPPIDLDRLLHNADGALYRSKAAGRNRTELHQETIAA
ncbi:GGDEF domain-containing protein [Rhizobium sp. SYY.PMSO]|uniref:GGDEF domain-containing protein n=1 Tax=Rhizobium sp. SYY.PMSO TaxID=3382192 RepID=UPI0039900A8A